MLSEDRGSPEGITSRSAANQKQLPCFSKSKKTSKRVKSHGTKGIDILFAGKMARRGFALSV